MPLFQDTVIVTFIVKRAVAWSPTLLKQPTHLQLTPAWGQYSVWSGARKVLVLRLYIYTCALWGGGRTVLRLYLRCALWGGAHLLSIYA